MLLVRNLEDRDHRIVDGRHTGLHVRCSIQGRSLSPWPNDGIRRMLEWTMHLAGVDITYASDP